MVFRAGETILNYIGGKWTPSVTGRVEGSINPADILQTVGYVQMSALEDLDQAVDAAAKARSAWRNMSGPARGEYLFRAADVLELSPWLRDTGSIREPRAFVCSFVTMEPCAAIKAW